MGCLGQPNPKTHDVSYKSCYVSKYIEENRSLLSLLLNICVYRGSLLTMPLKNYYERTLSRWYGLSDKYTYPSRIPVA